MSWIIEITVYTVAGNANVKNRLEQGGRVQLKCDGMRRRTLGGLVGGVMGKLANRVGSQYPSHYLGTWCIQHYYPCCAHLGSHHTTLEHGVSSITTIITPVAHTSALSSRLN